MLDQDIRNKYTIVIGLEVHAQLLTKSKIYASDSTEYGAMPNTQVGVVSLAHPGAMPKLNKKVVEYAIKVGLACESEITRDNIFDRKNYFYPDLPKGYQITQDKTPICQGGRVYITPKGQEPKFINLTRIHIEEDAGKSIHMDGETETLVDLNRAGVALIEIVTEPEIRSSEEAYSFLTEVRRLVRYLEVCDGNMEEGSMRADCNISVMLNDAKEFGSKVEVKNMNSIRNVQRAIAHETERQILAVEKGEEIVSETRTFDATTGFTASMRMKEVLNDYRYFPEPDLSPLHVSEEWLEGIRSTIPKLPRQLMKQFVEEFQLPEYDAYVLTDTKEIALYFSELVSNTKNYKAASNWMMGPVKSYLNELQIGIDKFPLSVSQIANLIQVVDEGKVSHSVAIQKIFSFLLENPAHSVAQVIEEQNLSQDSNEDSLLLIIKQVLANHPEKVQEYKNGKKGLIGMFMGQVMKLSKGKADPKIANQLLTKSLSEQ